jgi:succinyl-CoA synthetase beta subunit
MMVGKTLFTPSQKNDLLYSTNDQGFICRCVYVLEMLETIRKFYFKIYLDRNECCPVIEYADLCTGIRLYKLQTDHPELIKKVYVDFLKGVQPEQLMQMVTDLGMEEKKEELAGIIQKMYDFFIESDTEVLEIHPLVLTKDKELFLNSAKVKFDPNSLYR